MKRIAVIYSLAVVLCLWLYSFAAWALPEGAVARLEGSYGHNDYITSVAFSPDDRLLASGSEDETVKLWDLSTFQVATTLIHDSYVNSVAFSPDGRLLASGDDDELVKLWDTVTFQEVTTLVHGWDDWVLSVAFSPDGKLLASGTEDNIVKLWDLSTFQEVTTLTGHSDYVTSVAFSPDGRLLASGSQDNTIKLWDLSNFQEVTTLTGHGDYVNSVAFSPDGSLLASGSDSDTVMLWNPSTFQHVDTLTGHDDNVNSVAFSPDGSLLASGDDDGLVKVWDLSTSQEIRTLTGHDDDVTSVAFSPNGGLLASGSYDNTILLWAVPSSGSTPTGGNDPTTEPAGLVAYWNFDEGQGSVAHDIAGNNDGMINGPPTWVNGYFGSGLEFDGVTNYVDCGVDASLNVTEELTIAAWIKVDKFGAWDGIITKGIDSSSFSMQVWNDGALRFSANWGILTGAVGSGIFNSGATMQQGEWAHVAITHDGSVLSFYINGMLDSQVDQPVTFGTNTEPLILGCDFPGGDEYFDGIIDEVRIYDQVLSEADIQQIMGGAAPPPDQPGDVTPPSDMSGLVLHLPFDEGSGRSAQDISGYGNHGELLGNVQWANGKHGTAIYVSEDDIGNMVSVKHHSTLAITDELTMSAWVYVESMEHPWGSIITKGDDYMLHIDNFTDPNVTVDPAIRTDKSGAIWPSDAGVQIPFGEWHHVVGIYDGQEKRTYIDGVLRGSHARSGKITVTEANVAIGRDNRLCCLARRAALMIDDVMIFNRAISDAEVQLAMGGATTPDQPGDITAPVITSGPSAINITSNSAVITWTTDEASSSVVEYGSIDDSLTATGTGNTTSHSVTLTSLSPNTTYQYVVLSIDSSGNRVESDMQSFTTNPASTSGGFVLVGTDPDDSIVPNINQVFVYSDGENISFRVTSHSPWDRHVAFYIDIDLDQNPYTGNPEDGTDCSIGLQMEDGEYGYGFWIYDSSVGSYISESATLFDVWLFPNDNRYEVSISLDELGNPDAIDFLVWMMVVDIGDFAPKTGLYNYTIPSASSATDRTLSITSGEGAPGSSVEVQLSISDATGVAGGDVLIEYDPNMLTVGNISGTSLSSNINILANTNVPGEIRLGMAGDSIASGSGGLVNIEFMIDANAQNGIQATLKLSEADIYEQSSAAIPVNLQDGIVTITQPGIKGDMNNDGIVNAYDILLALQIAIGLRTPTAYELWAGDMNGDGVIKSDDVILIGNKIVGRAAPDRGIIVSAGGKKITITISETHGVAGENMLVPINVDNIDGLAGGDICITYDPAVLRAVDVSSKSDLVLASNVTTPGMVRIAFVDTGGLSSRSIGKIQFEILADDVSPLNFESVEFYGPKAESLNSRGMDQIFSSWAIPAENNALLQNFPNPFNPETWIPYQLKEDDEVTIRIYDISGSLVRELALGHKPAGLYINQPRAAYWDGRNKYGEKAASGLYFYTMQAGTFAFTRKMVVKN